MYYVSINNKHFDKHYHFKDCKYVKTIKTENIKKISDVETLKAAGYTACRECIDIFNRMRQREKIVRDLCSDNRLSYKRLSNYVFLKARFSEWYFDISSSMMVLYHKSFSITKPGKFFSDYHRQKQCMPFEDVKTVIQYICEHDARKYFKVSNSF